MPRRSLPPSLLAAIAIGVLTQLGYLMLRLIRSDSMEWGRLVSGLPLAVFGTGFVGAREIAVKLSGVRARAANLAAIGFALAFVLELITPLFAMRFLSVGAPVGPTVDHIYGIACWAALVTAVGGLAFASKRIALAVSALAVAVVGFAPSFVFRDLSSRDADDALILALAGARMAAWVVAGVALWFDATGEQAIEAPLANRGLRLMANSLWLRVGVAAFAAYAAFHDAGEVEGLAKLMAFGTPVIVTLSLLGLAKGALDVARSKVADVPRWSFVIAGAATLWCAGSMLDELVTVFGSIYATQFWAADPSTEIVVEIAVAIVAAGALVLAMTGISSFAWARQLLDLRAKAQANTIAFVVAMVGGIGLQRWCLANAGDEPPTELALAGLVAAIAVLAAVAIAPSLLRDANHEVESVTTLPSAKVVQD